MDEKEFTKFLEDICNLKPEQMEIVFNTFHEMFLHHARVDNSTNMPNAALAWRTKQAYLLIKHRNDKKLPPRR